MSVHTLSPLATITLAWAAIYAYVAVYSFTLRGYRAAERELQPFAIATFGMMIYAVGAALVADALDTASVVTAYRVVIVGGWIGAAGFMHFAHALKQRPLGFAVKASYALAGVSTIINLSGLMLDPGLPATPHPMLIEGLRSPLVPTSTTPYLVVTVLPLFVICAAAWVMRSPGGESDAEDRWLAVAGALLSVSAVHDAIINFLPVRSVYLLEHCYLLCALAMTHHLLGRVARTDDELARRREELRLSILDLHRTEAELTHKEQLAAVGELSAIIAQEVRHPIAAMRTALSELRERDASHQEQQHMLDTVDHESDRLNHLVGDLLTYAKPMHAQTSRVALRNLLERVTASAATTYPGIAVEIRLSEEPASIECDPELIHQALRNLIDSAIASAHDASRLEIETVATQFRGHAAVRVVISARDAARDNAGAKPRGRVRTAGTGLGLAIVDRVLRAHQGHLEMRGDDHQSLAIIVTLPLHAEGTPVIANAESPAFSSLFATPNTPARGS